MQSKKARHSMSSKITLAQAEDVRRRAAGGAPPAEIARQFGIARTSVHDILAGRSHRRDLTVHLTAEDFAKLQHACMSANVEAFGWLIDGIFRIGLRDLLEVQAMPTGEQNPFATAHRRFAGVPLHSATRRATSTASA
jgi:hypothetical protein